MSSVQEFMQVRFLLFDYPESRKTYANNILDKNNAFILSSTSDEVFRSEEYLASYVRVN